MSRELARKPVRMSLVNMATGVELTAQYNPAELNETIAVAYNRAKIVGYSSTVLQYSNTENHAFKYTLRFDGGQDQARREPFTLPSGPYLQGNRADFVLAARHFLLALCYSRRGGQTPSEAVPPRALFIWPSLLSLTCVITALNFKHHHFNLNLQPIRFDCEVSIEEIRFTRIYSEDVEVDGTFRSDNPNPGLGY